MKKILLFAATFAASSMAMAQENITPQGYDFETISNIVISSEQKSSNLSIPMFETAGGATEFNANKGLIAICGGQLGGANANASANIRKGISIVNLGGAVGKVLCIYGHGANLSEENKQYDFNTVYNANFAKCGGFTGYVNFHFALDPTKTPLVENVANFMNEKHVRISIIMNGYSTTGDPRILADIWTLTDQGGAVPNGSNTADNHAISSTDFLDGFEWLPNKWIKYEFDTYCKGVEENINYSPLWLTFRVPANVLNEDVLFVKSIKFYAVEDQGVDASTGRSIKYITLEPDLDHLADLNSGDPVVVDAIQAAINKGKTYDLSGREVSDKGHGLYIQEGKKVVK